MIAVTRDYRRGIAFLVWNFTCFNLFVDDWKRSSWRANRTRCSILGSISHTSWSTRIIMAVLWTKQKSRGSCQNLRFIGHKTWVCIYQLLSLLFKPRDYYLVPCGFCLKNWRSFDSTCRIFSSCSNLYAKWQSRICSLSWSFSTRTGRQSWNSKNSATGIYFYINKIFFFFLVKIFTTIQYLNSISDTRNHCKWREYSWSCHCSRCKDKIEFFLIRYYTGILI